MLPVLPRSRTEARKARRRGKPLQRPSGWLQKETGLPIERFPKASPDALEPILDDLFYPEPGGRPSAPVKQVAPKRIRTARHAPCARRAPNLPSKVILCADRSLCAGPMLAKPVPAPACRVCARIVGKNARRVWPGI